MEENEENSRKNWKNSKKFLKLRKNGENPEILEKGQTLEKKNFGKRNEAKIPEKGGGGQVKVIDLPKANSDSLTLQMERPTLNYYKNPRVFLVVGGQMIWAKKYHFDIINVALMITQLGLNEGYELIMAHIVNPIK